MKKIDVIADDRSAVKEIVHHLGTNAGGRGSCEGLAAELSKLDRTFNMSLFIASSCALCGSNDMILSPWQKRFGGGGVKFWKLAQLLRTCYSLHDSYEIDKLKNTVFSKWLA